MGSPNARVQPVVRSVVGIGVGMLALGLGVLADASSAPLLHARPGALAAARSLPSLGLFPVGQTGGAVLAVAVKGHMAYVGIGPRLAVMDLSDPALPRLVGMSAPLPDLVRDVAVEGGVAYVAAGVVGLAAIDVSDPLRPRLLNALGSSSEFSWLHEHSVAISLAGRRAFLVGNLLGEDGQVQQNALRVYDVGNPFSPVELGHFVNDGAVSDIAVAGDHVFVTAGGDPNFAGGLVVYGVRNPASIDFVAVLQVRHEFLGIQVAGRHAFIATADNGLQVIDLVEPTAPIIVGQASWIGRSRTIAMANGYAYVAVQPSTDGGDSELRVVDVRNPTSPLPIGRVSAVGTSRGVAVVGTQVVLAEEGDGIEVMDASEPSAARSIGRWDVSDYWGEVAVSGGFAFVADRTTLRGDRLAVLDVRESDAPREVGGVDLQEQSMDRPAVAGGIAAGEGYAYVTTQGSGADNGDALQVIDVRDPAAPRIAAVVAMAAGTAVDVSVAGGFAFVAGTRLTVVDVRDPERPRVGAHLDGTLVGVAEGVFAAGGRVHVAGPDGLAVVDVRDPAAPVVLAFAKDNDADNGLRDVVVAGDYAYVASEYRSQPHFESFDLRDPTHPYLAYSSSMRRGGLRGSIARAVSAAISEVGIAFVLTEAGDMIEVDARMPDAPHELGFLGIGGVGTGINADGPHLYTVAGYGGLTVFGPGNAIFLPFLPVRTLRRP